MMHKLEEEAHEYIVCRMQAIAAFVTQRQEDLLPAEVAPSYLAQWLKDVDLDRLDWARADQSFVLGTQDACWWLKKRITVPHPRPDWRLALRFDLGSQQGVGHGALMYLDGVEYDGFSPSKPGYFAGHDLVMLPDDLQGGQEVDLLLKIYTGRDHGAMDRAAPKLLRRFELVRRHQSASELYQHGRMVLRVIGTLDPSSGLSCRLVDLLKRALLAVDFSDLTGQRLYDSITAARDILLQGLSELRFDHPDMLTLAAVGHAHMDIGWTWPILVTHEKTVQTAAIALRLIDTDPRFIFLQSQPFLYETIRNDTPELYKRIVRAVQKERWDAEGGTWVESDCNIPSGEALVRQLIYGRRFFREELGVDSKVLWLVDSFGFPRTLPQIARGCGIEFFVTTKLSWSKYNRIPYTFFQWRGTDGTELPTYFMTMPDEEAVSLVDTYNAVPDPQRIATGWERRYPKEPDRELLNSIGWGNGGAGPTLEMTEWIHALDGIAGKFKARWTRAYPFLRNLMDRGGFKLPVWCDELFLEFHRGTLTTHADLKKYNRKCEIALQETEMIYALSRFGDYPAEEIRNLWRKVLTRQFHDILAGSSARDVFDEARAVFLETIDRCNKMIDTAAGKWFGQSNDQLAVFNTLGRPRDVLMKIDLIEGKGLTDATGKDVPVQRLSGSTALAAMGEIPSVGYCKFKVVDQAEEVTVDHPVTVKKNVLENRFLRVEFDPEDGLLTSIVDKALDREILSGKGNALQFFEDKPIIQNFSAFDIDRIYQDKPLHWSAQMLEVEPFGGPLRGGVCIERKYHLSRIKQEIYLDHNSPVLYFRNWIDWQESETLLKVAFPVSINTDQACFDIQFGHIHRPTHRNTLWDVARYEVPCQKWMDLSEGDYGVSLINDGKFGCDVEGHVLRLTLLRSSVNPDPAADRGFHEFMYGLYPHNGQWQQAKTVHLAKEMNTQPRMYSCRSEISDLHSYVQVQPESLVLETIKRAEDQESLVLRLYESANVRGTGRIKLDLPFNPGRAVMCNLEEQDLEPLTIEGGEVYFVYKPCQIITIKVYPS